MGELFEVVNPSDLVTFEADDELTAHLAVLLVGNGAYGTRTAEGKVVGGIYLFGFDAAAWLAEFAPDHASLDALILARSEAIERAFRTFAVASFSDRKAAPEVFADPERLARWNRAKRTSMNEIVARALQYAEALRVRREGQGPVTITGEVSRG